MLYVVIQITDVCTDCDVDTYQINSAQTNIILVTDVRPRCAHIRIPHKNLESS